MAADSWGTIMEDATEKRLMQRPVLLFVLVALLAAVIGGFIAVRGRDRQLASEAAGGGASAGIAAGAERFLSQADCRAALTSPPAAMKAVVLKHDGTSRTERYDVPMQPADAIRLCGGNGIRATFWTIR